MTAAKFPPKAVKSTPPQASLPTMYDLPSEDPEEIRLPDEYHLWQSQLCRLTFKPSAYPRDQVFVGSELHIYYDPEHPLWYKRPDWFAAVGVSRLYQGYDLRLSYVMWQEQVAPIIAIEFLSPSTQDEDLGKRQRKGPQPTKWEVYEQILAILYYVVFSRYTEELRVFKLDKGRYLEQSLKDDKLWLPELGIGLGLWRGKHLGVVRKWLRWYDKDDNWISTDAEQAEQDRQQKEDALQAKEDALQAKEAAEQRVQQLAERLQQLGIDPDEI